MNYAFQQPPRVRAGTVLENLNFCQKKKGTVLVKFDKKLTFKNCNLKNVAISPKWTIVQCNTSQADIPPPPTKRRRLAELKKAYESKKRRAIAEIAKIDAQIGAI